MISHATASGERPEQQDRFVVAEIPGGLYTAGWLLAVMDGHGGTSVAQLLAGELAATFEKTLKTKTQSIGDALRETVAELSRRTEQESSGSSLVMVFITRDNRRAYTAVLGDSIVLILDEQGLVRRSPLHNARCNPQEREAAIKRGGRYVDGYLEDPTNPGQAVQLSRALGDRALARVLSREPEIYTVPLGKSSLVLLASDGILDSFEGLETQFKRLMALARREQKAESLVQDALRRQTGDNVTVVFWKP